MINNVDRIVEKINELEDIAKRIEELYREFIFKCNFRTTDSILYRLEVDYDNYELKETQRRINRFYQEYYLVSKELVKEYLPSELSRFEDLYKLDSYFGDGVQNYIELNIDVLDPIIEKYFSRFIDTFGNQRNILLSIPAVIKSRYLDVRKIISSEFIQSELDESELLFENNHHRAAGAIAGVALERHLRLLCDKNGIEYTYKEFMNRINDKLKANHILQDAQWNYIRYLANLRNKCTHPDKIDVSEKDSRDLIDGTKKVIRECN